MLIAPAPGGITYAKKKGKNFLTSSSQCEGGAETNMKLTLPPLRLFDDLPGKQLIRQTLISYVKYGKRQSAYFYYFLACRFLSPCGV